MTKNNLIDTATKETGADEFRFDMRKPCDDCPFRKDAKLHLGVAKRIPDFQRGLDSGMLAHTCHKTDGRADGPIEGQANNVVQHCAGAMIFQMKCQGNKFPLLLAEAIENDLLSEDELFEMARADGLVFESMTELVDHYLALLRASGVLEKEGH